MLRKPFDEYWQTSEKGHTTKMRGAGSRWVRKVDEPYREVE